MKILTKVFPYSVTILTLATIGYICFGVYLTSSKNEVVNLPKIEPVKAQETAKIPKSLLDDDRTKKPDQMEIGETRWFPAWNLWVDLDGKAYIDSHQWTYKRDQFSEDRDDLVGLTKESDGYRIKISATYRYTRKDLSKFRDILIPVKKVSLEQ